MFPPGRDMLATRPLFTGIGNAGHHNRYCGGPLLGRQGCRGIYGEDDVDLEPYQFIRERGKSLILSSRMPRFNRDMFALKVTKLAESLLKGLKQSGRRGLRGQNTDAVYRPGADCASAASGAARKLTVIPEMNARRSITRSLDLRAVGGTAGL